MALTVQSSSPTLSRSGDIFWQGKDGNIWYKDGQTGQVSNMGTPQQAQSWNLVLNGAKEIADPVTGGSTASNTNLGTGGATTAAAPKVLDTAQLGSLDSLINSLGSMKDQSVQKAAIKRDTSTREKQDEKAREDTKYQGKKVATIQDFSGAKTDTDLNTTSTLENLVSSLSTLGLGGGRALTRQILDAANMSNRKANATQAQNNQSLDSAWNDYTVGNDNDIKKINDQYGYDEGEANRAYLKAKQDALYKKADVYNAADKTAERAGVMNEANGLNGLISGATFLNPSYTGESKAMATPDLADYTQDIAKYSTALDLGDGTGGVIPVGAADGTTGAGNLAVRAIAVNDKDLGIKKKTENDLGYGV
jgi:hypothetical protein